MKKNLFFKNKKLVKKKIGLLDILVLNKAILKNFYFLTDRKFCLFFNNQFILNKKGPLGVSNLRSQCFLTWRSGSVYSFFKLTRLTLRDNFSFGFVKGLRKSSW